MKKEQILDLAYDMNAMPEQMTDETLIAFANEVERRTLERAAVVCETGVDTAHPTVENVIMERHHEKLRQIKYSGVGCTSIKGAGMNTGRVARTAGLVITTAISTAAINSTTWDNPTKAVISFFAIVAGAFLAAMAADFGDGK